MPVTGLTQSQGQTQILSPRVLQTVTVLAMNAADVCAFVAAEAEQNPALDVVRSDALPLVSGGTPARDGEAISDAFQAFLESRPAPPPSLREHLREQFALVVRDSATRALGERLIDNLDDKGFHIVPPADLLTDTPAAGDAVLAAALDAIRMLDPIGCGCIDVAESLRVQAAVRGDAPPLARTILDGNLALLEPPRAPLVLKKVRSLSLSAPPTLDAVEDAIAYIRTLTPYPGYAYSTDAAVAIAPDIVVSRVATDDSDDVSRTATFRVRTTATTMPQVRVSPEFSSLSAEGGAGAKFARGYVNDAQRLISLVEMRQQTILKTAKAIVAAQTPFFEHGKSYLRPLRMKDIADTIGVHEATVSRAVNGKYLQCEWGLFELRSFFVNQASAESNQSKETVKSHIRELIAAADTRAHLSDSVLVTQLADRGITIARRTVAKYRAELDA